MSETSPPVSATVRCPGCGAEIGFRIGSSRILICDHCSFAVARTQGGFDHIGRVADVIPTGTLLSLGARGGVGENRFTLVGRIQLDWGQGRWDEWYAAFDDGAWVWIAEAAGHYYMSARVDSAQTAQMEHPEKLVPGEELEIPGQGRFVFSDRKRPRYVAARGELPESVPLDGSEFLSLDLSGPDGKFATLDYSDDPQHPSIFVGKEVSFEALQIDVATAPPPEIAHERAAALTCPQCRAPITLQVPDQAKRVTCTHCNALLDASQGALLFLQLVEKSKFDWQLGSHCSFFELEYVVVGWMRRGCTVEGEHYTWEEYLLYDPKHARYRFLVKSDGHWSFVTPIAPGDVTSVMRDVNYKGTLFRRFASVEATVEHVYGEFYWEVAQGETVTAVDYIAPPEGLSEERGADEVNWSHATYVTPSEVRQAFGGKHVLWTPTSAGSLQPNPVDYGSVKRVRNWSLSGAVALFAVFHWYANGQVVFSSDLASAAPEHSPAADTTDAGADEKDEDGGAADAETPDEGTTADTEESAEAGPDAGVDSATPDAGDSAPYQSVALVTEPFEIPRAHRNMRVDFTSNVSNSWAGLDATLVNEDTNEVYDVELESSYYFDDDGVAQNQWNQTAYLSQLPAGTYVLRAELDWDKIAPRPRVTLKLTSGVPRVTHFFEALAALLVMPLISGLRYRSFERARWEDSTESE